MSMKRVVAACAILILIAITCAISVGWLLAHPVQTAIGNPPADLNYRSLSRAIQVQLSTVGQTRVLAFLAKSASVPRER